jgi:hypothetical protein
MANWAVLDANNLVSNIIVADTQEIATTCAFGARVIEYTDSNPVCIGFTYLENNEWRDDRVKETPSPLPIPVAE